MAILALAAIGCPSTRDTSAPPVAASAAEVDDGGGASAINSNDAGEARPDSGGIDKADGAAPSRARTGAATLDIDIKTTVGEIPDLTRTAAGIRTALQRCYDQGTPGMPGTVRLTMEIAKSGTVRSLTSQSIGSITNDVVDCMTTRAHAAVFRAPTYRKATVMITVTSAPDKP